MYMHAGAYIIKFKQFCTETKVILMVAFLRKRQCGLLARALINHKTDILYTHQGSLLELTINRLQREGITRKVNSFKFNNGMLLCALLYLPFKSNLSHDVFALTFPFLVEDVQ